MKKSLTLLAGLVVMLAFIAPAVSAFEISGKYTEEGQKWLNEHWDEDITLGELAKIAYTEENYEKIKENVDPKLLEKIWSQPYYWGERYPPKEVIPGPLIFENGKHIEDPDGSILEGIMKASIKSVKSGIILDPDAVTYSRGYIHYGASGYVYGADTVGSLRIEAKLYGNGDWLETSYKVKYNYDNDPYYTLSTSGIRSPVSDTLYQALIVGQSTDPDDYADCWSPSYYYP